MTSLRWISGTLVLCLLLQDAAFAIEVPSHNKSAAPVSVPSHLGLATPAGVRRGAETVINIQDAHAKLGAQESIASILDGLVRDHDLRLVALEGAAGEVDPSLLSSFPEPAVRKRTGERLLSEGRISAGEYYAIASGGAVALYGAEESGLYRQNVETFSGLVSSAPAVRSQMRALRSAMTLLEQKVYSDELAEAQRSRLGHDASSASFTDHWKSVAAAVKRHGIDLSVYPSLDALSRLFELERHVKFAQAQRQREELLAELSRRLAKKDLESLFLDSLRFKRGMMPGASYHRALVRTAARFGASTEVRDLLLYTEYLEAFEGLDLTRIIDEARALDRTLVDHTAKSADEKALVRLRLSFETISRCLAAGLSGAEYGSLEKDPALLDLSASLSQLRALGERHGITVPTDDALHEVHAALPMARAFYRLASERDRALFENTVRRMRRDGVRTAALISGGFHTRGISRIAEEEGVSCLIVMPRFDDSRGDRPYITVLTRTPKEMEKAFEGSDEFLAATPLFAAGERDDASLVAGLLGDARMVMGGKYQRASRLYLRELARNGARLSGVTLKEIGRVLSQARRGQNLRREKGGVLVRFAERNYIVASQGAKRTGVSTAPKPQAKLAQVPVAFRPMAKAGARLSVQKAAVATATAAGTILGAGLWHGLSLAEIGWMAVSLLSLSPVVFGCGIFDILEPSHTRQSDLIPADSMASFSAQISHTEQRGSQGLGKYAFVVLSEKEMRKLPVEGAPIDVPTALAAPSGTEERIAPVLTKVLNRRGSGIRDRFVREMKRQLGIASKKGAGTPPMVSIGGHSRLATGGGNSVAALHPHMHLGPRVVGRWEFRAGRLERAPRVLANLIAHNGDFNAAFLFGRVVPNHEVRAWLDRVLHQEYGNGSVPGDSPAIAGMMDLLNTQGMWYASVRLAYQLAVASDIDSPVPGKADLSGWASLFEREFIAARTELYPSGAGSLEDFEPEAAQRFIESMTAKLQGPGSFLGALSEARRAAFVQEAFSAFVSNDPKTAFRSFMHMAHDRDGSTFGLSYASTVDPWRRHYASHKQPFYIGQEGRGGDSKFRGASEFSAVRSTLDPSNSRVLRMDQENGEIATVDLRHGTVDVYSIEDRRDIQDLGRRWQPLNNPYFNIDQMPDTEDRVLRDIEYLANMLALIRDQAHLQRPFDAMDKTTYNTVSFDRFAGELVRKAEEAQALSLRLAEAGIEVPMRRSELDVLLVGIENSLEAATQFAEFLGTVFPDLKNGIAVAHSNEYLLDPGQYNVGPNTLVFNLSRSGQTFSTYHATVDLKRRGVRSVFILTRDLGSEMAAAIGQSFDPQAEFLGAIITDGGYFSTSEPASQSVMATHATLNQLVWHTVRRMHRHFGEGQRPLGMMLTGRDLQVIERIEGRMISRELPAVVGRDLDGNRVESAVRGSIVEAGRRWARHIEEGGKATAAMKAYVFASVLLGAPLFGGVALLNAVFYTWGGEIVTFFARYRRGRQLMARFYGQRTVKIFSRDLHHYLDVYFGKLFAEAPGYFSTFRRSANIVREALQTEAFDVTRGTMVFMTVPDGRFQDVSAKIGREQGGAVMTGTQTRASGNVMGTTPEVVAMVFDPQAAARRGFEDVVVIPSSAPDELKRSSTDNPALVADLVSRRVQSLQMLAASYLFFWAVADKVSTVTIFGRKFRLWDPAKTQDQAQTHTTAAPVPPVELAGLKDPSADDDWVAVSMVGHQRVKERLDEKSLALQGARLADAADHVLGAKRIAPTPSAPMARAGLPFKRLVVGLLLAAMMGSAVFFSNFSPSPPPVSAPPAVTVVETKKAPAPEPKTELPAPAVEAVPVPAPVVRASAPAAPVRTVRESGDLRKAMINFKLASEKISLRGERSASWYLHGAEKRLEYHLNAGNELTAEEKVLIESARSSARAHLNELREAAVAAPVSVAPAPVVPPAVSPVVVPAQLPVDPPAVVTPGQNTSDDRPTLLSTSPTAPAPTPLGPGSTSPSVDVPGITLPAGIAAQADLYADFTNIRGAAPKNKTPLYTFSTLEMSATWERIRAGLTLETNASGLGTAQAGTTVPKFALDVTLGGTTRFGLRRTVGDALQPISGGLMFSASGPSISVAPEFWLSHSGKGEGAANAILFTMPVKFGPFTVTPSYFSADGNSNDWQMTGNFDKGKHHIFTSRNFKNPDVARRTHLTPDTGDRVGYGYDFRSFSLGGYFFRDPSESIGKGVGAWIRVPLGRIAPKAPQAAPAPQIKTETHTPSGARLSVGVILTAGHTPEQAQRLINASLGNVGSRLSLLFAEAGPQAVEGLIRRGAALVVTSDAIADGDTQLSLLRSLADLEGDSLEVLLPFVSRLLAGHNAPLSVKETRSVVAVIAKTFPDAAPRTLLLTSRGLVAAPQTSVRIDNTAANAPVAGPALAERLDQALFDVLTGPAASDGRNLSGLADALTVYLSERSRSAAGTFAKKVSAMTDRFASTLKARLAWTDPSYRVDLSILSAQPTNLRRTVVTDLDVFLKDADGKAFGLRMERLDRQAKGMFRHALLVRDGRFTDRESLNAAYPETERFGDEVIFAPGISEASALFDAKKGALDPQFVVLMPRPGQLKASADPRIEKALVVSLEEGSKTTAGILEKSVLYLLKAENAFQEIIFKPLAAVDYELLLSKVRAMASLARAA